VSIEEIELELELAGVPRDKALKLLSFVKANGFDAAAMDKKLQSMGFEKVFTIYDE